MLKVSQIRMDYELNPVGTAGMPEFSWKLESDRMNVMQTGYCLQISCKEDFRDLVYTSGWQESSESAHVKVEGLSLKSHTRYYVRVSVRAGGEESPYCGPGSFVTGILEEAEWRAVFISGETQSDQDNSKGTYLRTQKVVEGDIESAFVTVTALGLYRFYINGKKVGQDEMTPGWTSYHRHLCCQTYDVAEYLHKGNNTFGAMLGAGWYKGEMGFLHLRNNYGDRTAFLMQMTVRFADGSEKEFLTGTDDWQGADSPVVFSEIYDGEIYDARLELPGWNEETENADGDKKEASQVRENWHEVSEIAFDRKALTAQAASKVGIMDELPAVRVFLTPEKDTVIDFGQNLTGWVKFRVRGREGAAARLRCFETLDASGNVYTANLRKAKQEITYICRDDREAEYHPHFTFYGFRYVQVLEWPCEVKAEDFTALTLHSRMEQTGTFSCSHPLVNQLQHNILWGLKSNFLDIPTDCPQRDERMGWTGDAQIFCRTACYLMNADTFFRKWLKDVACDQTTEGGVPHIVPDIVSGREENDWLLSQGTHSAAAWADVAVINPWTMYLTYGDRQVLEDQYDSMKRWIDFMQSHSQDYIWNYKLQFGDWVALDAEEGSYFGATPNDLTCTAYFAYSTGLFIKAARALGREADVAEYGRLYGKIVEKFRKTFFQADGSMTAMTQTAHIVALTFGLVPEEFREKTARTLVELLEKENGHLVTGFVGTPYFCHALSANGYVKEAYDLLLKEDFPSWLYQIKMGATTVWEHWDGLKPDGTMWSPDMNSFNHYAYGAVGEWIYRVVLGLETDELDPGYHHSLICPQPGDVFDYAEGSYESVYGTLSVRWDRKRKDRPVQEIHGQETPQPEEILLKVTIPPNTTADIRLEKGAVVREQGELSFTETDGILTAACGSGIWTVRYERCSQD